MQISAVSNTLLQNVGGSYDKIGTAAKLIKKAAEADQSLVDRLLPQPAPAPGLDVSA